MFENEYDWVDWIDFLLRKLTIGNQSTSSSKSLKDSAWHTSSNAIKSDHAFKLHTEFVEVLIKGCCWWIKNMLCSFSFKKINLFLSSNNVYNCDASLFAESADHSSKLACGRSLNDWFAVVFVHFVQKTYCRQWIDKATSTLLPCIIVIQYNTFIGCC